MSSMTPQEIVSELDRHIVGQKDAKRAVAIALRNRWRRQQVDEKLRPEITPKNILMIGPTGVGKTEIARRLAQLANAPFIKVEATKFTEVGYVGKDVDSIIRDLAEMAVKQTREQEMKKHATRAEDLAEDRVLEVLIPSARNADGSPAGAAGDGAARQTFRKKLREGQLDDKEIEIELAQPAPALEVMGPAGMEEMAEQLKSMIGNLGAGKRKLRRVKIGEAMKLLVDEEAGKLLNEDEVRAYALKNLEQNGIVFIDEIDKVASRSLEGGSSADVSRQGVQRDLLPLVEGTTVSTKYGMVRTDHILFIASGAFHLSKPSDLIPELQGRFPIRVELDSLSTSTHTPWAHTRSSEPQPPPSRHSQPASPGEHASVVDAVVVTPGSPQADSASAQPRSAARRLLAGRSAAIAASGRVLIDITVRVFLRRDRLTT